MNKSMTQSYKAFHELFQTSCSMRAELDRILSMAHAYPHLQDIVDQRHGGASDPDMVRALKAAKQYEIERTFPPAHVVEQLYVAAVQMLDELDRIEHDRIAAVELANGSMASAEQRNFARLVEDFNVNVGEVNMPAREAIESIRPYLARGQEAALV